MNFYDDNPNKENIEELQIPLVVNEFKESLELAFEHIPAPILKGIEKLKKIHYETGNKIEEVAHVVDGFVVWEHLATGGLIVMATFCSWIIFYFRLGFGWLFLLTWYLSFVYSKNIKRLRYKIKNQALKEHLLGVLDSDTEYVEWFNQFLARFWINFEPSLSKSLKESINGVLDGVKAPGIDDISLTKFTLGSQAPRIDSIKTFVNSGDDKLVLDFDLSFTPLDEDSVSKKEMIRKELRNLEVVLTAKITLVPLPVSLKEVYINGKLRVQFTFMTAYPHIKVIDLGFVKQPDVDFILKPLGTDLSKIAGLGSLIKDVVDNQLKQIAVNPVKISLPIGEWMGDSAGTTETPVGVLRVVIYEGKGVKNVDVTGVSDPSATILLGGNEVAKTRVIYNNLDPQWSEVHHVIIYQSMLSNTVQNVDQFKVVVNHTNALTNIKLGSTDSLSLRKWIGLMGIGDIGLADTRTEEEKSDLALDWGSPFETNGHVWKTLELEGKKYGAVRLDISYFPIIQPDLSAPNPILAGVVTITVMQAKELQYGHCHCVGKIDSTELFKTATRKRTSNPSWNSTHLFYCGNISKANLSLQLFGKTGTIGNCKLNIKMAVSDPDDWYKVLGGTGKLRVAVKFQPLDLLHSSIDVTKIRRIDPIGLFRVKVTEAKDLSSSLADMATLQKCDPYCKVYCNGRALGVTSLLENTTSPKWQSTFYTFSYSMRENITLDVFDSNNLQKDRKIGKASICFKSIFENAKNNQEIEGLSIKRMEGGILDVWAPLFEKDAKSTETSPRTSYDDLPSKKGAAEMEKTQPSITSRKRGSIRIEFEFFPISAEDILNYKVLPEFDPDITPEQLTKTEDPKNHPSPASLPVTVRKTPKQITDEFGCGILRVRINNGTFEKKCRPYLETWANGEMFLATFTCAESSEFCQWFSSIDNFMIELPSTKFIFKLKDQVDEKRSSKDKTIGIWSGDVIDTLLGKGVLKLPFREAGDNQEYSESAPVAATIELIISYYPVPLKSITTKGNMGVLHLDILRCNNLPSVDTNGKNINSSRLCDPYVLVDMNGKNYLKTKTHKKNLNPVFDEGVDIDVHSRIRSTIFFEVKDYNQFSSNVTVGTFAFSLRSVVAEQITTLDFPLDGKSGTLTVRFLFEERVLESAKDTSEQKLKTEASALGKFGKGLTHQVTGLGSVFGSALTAPLKEKRHRATVTSERPSVLAPVITEADKVTLPEPEVIVAPSLERLSLRRTLLTQESTKPQDSSHVGSSPFMVPLTGASQVEVHIVAGKDLKAVDSHSTSSDPFIRVTQQGVDKGRIHKTAVIKKNLNPTWENEKFIVPLDGPALKFSIFDKNLISSDVALGHVVLDPATMLEDKKSVDEWFRVQSGSGSLHIILTKSDQPSSMKKNNSRHSLLSFK